MVWAAREALSLLTFVVWVACGGLLAAIWRRRLSGRALAVGTLALGLGVWLTLELALGRLRAASPADLILWLGVLASMAFCGALMARVKGGLAYYECTLAAWCLAACLALFAACRVPLHRLGPPPWQAGSVLSEAWTAGLAAGTPWEPVSAGALMLGAIWRQQLALLLAVGLLVALTAASLAHLATAGSWRMEAWVARRHLRGRRASGLSLTAVVATLGIALGVASLVAVTAVMSGYQADIQAKILAINPHLVLQKYGLDFHEHAALAAQARQLDGVLGARPFVFNEVMISGGEDSAGAMLKGVGQNGGPEVTRLAQSLAPGSPPLSVALGRQDGLPGLVVGEALMRRLDLHIGDRISLTTPSGMASVRGQAPRRALFHIGGALASGMHEFDAGLVVAELGAAQAILGMAGTVTGIELRLARPEMAEAMAGALLASVGGYPYHTLDWRQLNGRLFTALSLQKATMYLVLICIVVVASFNIASTLFMAVVERAQEIAVLKSMGAGDVSILRIFVLQGWAVGVAGTALGIGVGVAVASALGSLELGLAADVYMVESLRVHLDPKEVGATALAALGISHLATLYPSLRAAQALPAQALRAD